MQQLFRSCRDARVVTCVAAFCIGVGIAALATACSGSSDGLSSNGNESATDAGDHDAIAINNSSDASIAPDGADASTCPAGLICTKAPLFTSKIGMWYTLWWMPGDDSGHWHDWARYQPLAGYYQSGQGAAFQTHLADFAAMKLDYLLLDHTNGINNDNGDIKANGEALLATLESSTLGIKQVVAGGAPLWMGASPDIAGQQAEDDYVFSIFANPKSKSRELDSNGLPLFVIYTSPGHGDDFTDARFSVGSATGAASDATTPMRNRGVYGWVFSEPTIVGTKVMGAMSGWSTAHLGRATTPILREGGNLFIREWLKAIKQNPETIMINSWNDFAEETAIEPATRTNAAAELWADSYGTECPSFYYELAKAYSLLRWGLQIDSYVREETDTSVFKVTASGLAYQSTMPACHPVVFVPDGYLAQFTHL